MNLTRTLIIGNSGSGKSWLAKRLAKHLKVPWIDLDRIHWVSDEHSIARPGAAVLGMARIAASEEQWVIEGVYGWIISELVHRATALIWLCVDDEYCVANIRQREEHDDERLISLLEWAENYHRREDSSGLGAHRRLFQGFGGTKIKLEDRGEITAFIDRLLRVE